VKVLLIYPPSFHMITTNVPSEVEEASGVYPPLGLLYVAAYAEKHTSADIAVLDTQAEGLDYKQIEERISAFGPDVVGIQTMTFTLIDAIETARTVKRVSKDIHVCLGGPHVNIYPEETLEIPDVDSLVMGEGEMVFSELIQCLDEGKSLEGVTGVAFRRAGEVMTTGRRPFISDLDALPHPARHLVPYKEYTSALATETPITTMMSSRGCPFRCIFCDRPHLGKVFRARSPESIAGEMEECQRMGIKEVFFYDDTFNVKRRRVLDLCRLISAKGIDLKWDIRARVDRMDEEMLRALKDAGCVRIHYGVESGTPEIIKALRKDIDLSTVRRIIGLSEKLGITTLAYFMIGNPGETREQIHQTIKFAKSLPASYVHISVTTPFPATELYQVGLDRNVIPDDHWRNFARKPSADFVPTLWEENLTRDELIDLLKYAYGKFYFRPVYMLRRLLEVRSAGELKRKARAALRLAKVWLKG